MIKSLKINVLFAVAVMYMMVAGGFTPTISTPVAGDADTNAVAMQHKLTDSSQNFSVFALHESSYTTLSNGPVFSFTGQWEIFKAVISISEEKVHQDLIQRVTEIINFPIRIRKADLLFPFHYFF